MQLRAGRWMRGFVGLIRYGGLIGVHRSARLSLQGSFEFGQRVSIGRNSIIQVPAHSRLSLGDSVYIGREVEVTSASEISIGNFTTVQDRCNFLGDVEVGANCIFAPNVFVSSGIHQFRERAEWLIRDQDALIAEAGYAGGAARSLPIRIHDDCWIGINVVVMRGVTIGRGCVVGANSVVTNSAEPYSVLAGSPAKLISRRLEFRRPRAISSDNSADLPYFYSGFDLRQQTIASSPAGHRAFGNFRLALDRRQAGSIRVEFVADRQLSLICSPQKATFASGSHSVSFLLSSSAADDLVTIEARDAADRPCGVSIRRAFVED